MIAANALSPVQDAAGQAQPRLGFLGTGWIGRARLRAIRDSGKAQIVAVADPSAEAREAARKDVPEAGIFDSLSELLAHDLDGIVIATPSAMHAEQSIWALEQGAAVFCQKPLARSARETARVLGAARQANRLLSVDFSYRYIEGVRTMRDLIQSGALGHVYAAHLVFHNAYGPDKQWFYDPTLSGGGCVMDLGIHLLDLLLWTLDGQPVRSVDSRLFAGGRPLSSPDDAVEDYATAQITLEDDTTVQLACSWNLPAGREAIIEASFYGTKGGAALRNRHGSFFAFDVMRFKGTETEMIARSDDSWSWGGGAIENWTRQLRISNSYSSESEQLLQVAAAVDRIYGREAS